MKRIYCYFKTMLFFAVTLVVTNAVAQTGNGLIGFAGYGDLGLNGVTGGGAGQVVHVSTRADFQKYVTGSTPYVIILDADIDGAGKQDYQLYKDQISVGSNKTIIGAGSGKTIDGICLDISNQQNLIFRNLYIKHGNDDAIAMRNCHHVWVDHCDLSESYDGLLDFTVGSDYLTCSWTKLHDHDKVSITNSGTCHYEDYGKEHVTFAHCWFANNVQRNPRIGYGKMHIYNGYWTDISSYCIGFHSQAQVLSENNYFTASANHPFNNQYTSLMPYCGFLTDKGSYFANGTPSNSYSQPYGDISYTPLTYYNYDFDLVETKGVPVSTKQGSGPQEGLQYEPILCPANGAIEVPLSQRLSWGTIDGNPSAVKVLLGKAFGNLDVIDNLDELGLQPSTTYYWQVIATINGQDHASPVYQFTTAAETAANPYPADKATDPWLRWPSTKDGFTTAMPLTWRQAAEAKSYKVYLTDNEAGLDAAFVGETTKLTINPGNLTTGKTYFWRVDVVKTDGAVVKGNVWSFSTPNKKWNVGKNEAENRYLSAMAFVNNLSGYSSNAMVRGDQGPGSIIGTFNGEAGTYAISTTHKNQTSGPTLYGLFVNNKALDAWMSSTENGSTATRQTRQTVQLQPGDEIRLDFVSGYVDNSLTEAYAIVDYITITPATGDVVETNRPSGQYHEPVSTKGYDCEYLRLSDVLFTDSLGTVGDKGSEQVKDKYCSWISKNDEQLTLYLKQTAMVKRIYRSATNDEAIIIDILDANSKTDYAAPKTADGNTLYALRIYKTLPVDTVYYAPTADEGSDCMLLYSPDCIFIDSKGVKGDKGKGQIRDEYDQWMKYTNPSANEVHTKNSGNGIKAYINPETDEKVNGYVPKGRLGTTDSYCVGSSKYMTYFLQKTKKVKFYISGTAGNADKVEFTVTPLGEEPTVSYSGVIGGKNVASGVKVINLAPEKQYQIKLLATAGDMLIYAAKFWPADDTDNIDLPAENSMRQMPEGTYNLNGQKVGAGYRGLVIRNGKKCF